MLYGRFRCQHVKQGESVYHLVTSTMVCRRLDLTLLDNPIGAAPNLPHRVVVTNTD